MKRRPAAMAGRFYPGTEQELRAQIEGFLATARLGTTAAAPKAMITPHAGTIYSGPVAATAYVRLECVREQIHRVVLLGPSHRVRLSGLAASTAEAFETPLGDVVVDHEAVADLVQRFEQVQWMDEAHRSEHSLEVHLPFLQSVLENFTLVPLVVGRVAAETVSEVIDHLWGGPETLVVVSSDLSHFESYETAKRLDRETSDLIEQLAFEQLRDGQACGLYPMRGLLLSARNRNMTCVTVDLRSSGDTTGARREVVGYGSYLLQ